MHGDVQIPRCVEFLNEDLYIFMFNMYNYFQLKLLSEQSLLERI